MAARHKYRLACQTINKQNKLPCKASGIQMKNGNIRCRIHGGWSTGPKTVDGKIKAFRNLKQFKNSNDETITHYIRDFQRHSYKVDGRNSTHNYLPSQRFAKPE